MLKRKKMIKTLLAIGTIGLSLNFGVTNVSATETQYPPVRTVNNYNVYKPIKTKTESNTDKSIVKETTKAKGSVIADYEPTSTLKTVDVPVLDYFTDVVTKSSDNLFTSVENQETYTISEDGKVTLANNRTIEKKLLNTNYSVGQTLQPEYIIIHDTGNRGSGADADAHYKYWTSGRSEKTSAHFVVDEDTVMQLLELDQVGWHTGKMFTNNPEVPQAVNKNSIGIELCVNEDGNFIETMKNGIELTKYLMKEYNIPAEKVITHNQATGKICPAMMIKDNPALWKLFKAEISKVDKTETELKIADTLARP